MNVRLAFVILAGVGSAFLLPLPRMESEPAPVIRKASTQSRPVKTPVPLVISSDEAQETPLDLNTIARMDRAACLDALDSQLKRYRSSQPTLEQEEIINALTLRLFREKTVAGGPAFPGTRNLPAWLLHSAWLATAMEAEGVPDTLRRALPTMPEGWMAGPRIAKSIAAMDAEAALAFEKSMPGDWRKEMRESRLQGLAGVHPLEAARQTKPNDKERTRVVMTAAREAPMKEVIEVLVQYSADLEAAEMKSAMMALNKRDPAALKRLLEARGDPHLSETLAKISTRPDPPETTGRSLSEVLAAARLDPKSNSKAIGSAIMETAVQDPDAAISAWAGLKGQNLGDGDPVMLLVTLARHHPAKALAFSEEHLPSGSGSAVNVWVETDAPGALRAILDLPYSSVFRQQVVEELKGNGRSRGIPFVRVSREDLLLAAQELPPELLRQILPDN